MPALELITQKPRSIDESVVAPPRTPYRKPKIVQVERMAFPLDLIMALHKGVVCRQCSSCHGCR